MFHPSLVTWFNTDDLSDIVETQVGSTLYYLPKVSLWKDKTGNGNDAKQDIHAHRPMLILDSLYDFPCVRFDGSDVLQAYHPNDNPSQWTQYHFFAVTTVHEETAGGCCVLGYTGPISPGQEAQNLVVNEDTILAAARTEKTIGFTNPVSYPSLVLDTLLIAESSMNLVRQTNHVVSLYNGGLSNPGVGQAGGTLLAGESSLRIGSSRDNLIKPLNGDVFEIMIFSSELKLPDRAVVLDYLSDKYSIALETT